MMSAVSWKTQAIARQQEVCELVIEYDWELYKKSEREYLERKVQYILFGPVESALNEETKLIIQKICEKILEEGNRGQCSKDETCMAFVYVFWTEKEEDLKSWPVFKVPNDKSGVDSKFIDINARVYSSWADFLENNQFPPCEYCYPLGGEYSTDNNGAVVVEFGKSPATRFSKSVIQYLDYANAGLAVGTTAVAAASIFVPVAGPLLQASLWLTRGICAYTTMRSGSTLIDRGTHKQSVGLHDGESRNCWLSIGGSFLGAASSSATTVTAKMAQSGQVMGRLGCATVTALNVGSVAMNGLGLLNSFHLLIEKLKKDQLTSLDVFQFSASLLLFAHAAVNIQTAKSIIENTQNNVLQEFENNLRSNRHRKMFRKVARNTKYEKNTIEGNAQVIRSLKHINNVDDFFSALVRMDKQFCPTQSRAKFTEGGLIIVNENLSIDPVQLVQATPEQRVLILEATKQYAGNQISEAEFKSMTESIIGKSPTIFAQQGSQLPKISTLKELLGLGKSRGKSIQKLGSEFSYPLLNAYERMELITMLKKFAESDHEQILRITSTLLKALGWTSGLQYVEVAYFVCGLIRSIASNNKVGKGAVANINGMSASKYCQIALQEFLKDPSNLVQIFNHIQLLFNVLSERHMMATQFRHIGLFEITQLAAILLVMDRPLWLRLITFAEEIFCILGLRQPEKIITIVKGLCLSIQNMLKDVEVDFARKHYNSLGAIPRAELVWNEASREVSQNHCSTILNTLTADTEIRESLVEELRRDYVKEASEEIVKNNTELKYTEQQPLVINRSFWVNGELSLLSEEEILDICQQSLCTDLWPTDCNIEHDGSNIFVNIDEKLVVIQCNFDEEKLSAYVAVAATL